MKNFSFDGRLGSDAEVKTTKGGKPYVRFSVANNSFNGGTESTEWIDVTSYDQYVVENRAKYLTKGTYVIVNGDVRFDVKFKDQKLWKNIYVTAYSIDTPSFGKRDEDAQASQAAQTSVTDEPSTYTPQETYTQSEQAETPTYHATVQQTAPAFSTASSSVASDDLPF